MSQAVPMVDLRAQMAEIGEDLKRAVCAAIDSAAFIMGPEVGELESALARSIGVRHAIGVSSGTDALMVALMALDVGPGHLVLTTTYSFFATAGVVTRLGARPVFLDIDPGSYNIDPSALATWFDEHPDDCARVKAIVPVHLFGQCADMDPILAVAARHGVAVVEDAAQAIGATYPGKAGVRQAGSMGTIGAYSFFPSKNLGGIGDGGLVVTDDDALADKLRTLRVHGAKPKYYHPMVGGNFRLDTIQAAALLVKLPHLERWHGMRRERAAVYDRELARARGVELPPASWGPEHHVYNQYVIRCDRRDALRDRLTACGVESSIFYPVPFHLQECFRSLGYRKGELPHAERAAATSLALPIYPEMPRAQQDRVIDAIRSDDP